MEKVLKFLKNKWFLLGISFLSFIYVYFLGKIVLRAFDSYLETENFSAMMVMYVFVNFIFGVLMFFTRKQIPTVISALIIPLEALLLMIVSFGQWYIIIPPVVVGAVVFLSCGVGESCKTVMGTLLLIMFVAGGLAYSVMSSYFGISLRFVATDLLTDESQDIDFSTRSMDYLVTEDGKYRLVYYVEHKEEHTVTSYYVEEAFKDSEYPYAVFRRTFGCRNVLVTAYERNVNPKWISNDKLSIDGKILTMEEVFAPKKDDEAEETTAAEETKKPSRTTAPEVTEITEEQTEEETEAAE
ncbi:MAG: hypothetical protein K2K41_01790 [Ruminiclostridium sp.]|nr:hypothetical protein [Ruminiclostridium sp.]